MDGSKDISAENVEMEENSDQKAPAVEEKTREDEILGGTKALLTILKLSVGPFFSQVTNSLYGFINTLWVTKAVGQLAATALSSSTSFDSLSVSAGIYFSTCAISKIAALHGEHRSDMAAQLIVDLMRFSLIFAIGLPAILIPVSKPMLRWFGAEEDVVELALDYLTPLLSCTLITIIYLLLCGCLQAEGRTIIFAIAQVSSLVLSAGVFSPLFLLGCKSGICGVSYSLVCSQLVPGIVLFYCYFTGKFTAKPTFKMFLNKFSPEVWETLNIGVPSLISAVACSLPSIIFIKFLGNASESTYEFNTMMTIFNAYNRTYQIMVALFMAITSGYLPSASFAFAAGRFKRVIYLTIHMTWLVMLIAILFTAIIIPAYKPISRMFSDDPFFTERFRRCLNSHWATPVLAATQFISTPLLQATQHPTMAFIVSFVTLLVIFPGMAVLNYFTDKHDTVRLFFAVMENDVLSFLFLLPFTIVAIKDIVVHAKEEAEVNKKEHNVNEEEPPQIKVEEL